MIREWKTITYAQNYDVSNCGEVRQNKKNKILKPYINKRNGYSYVFIRDNNGKYLNKRIHRLVAECFIPNPLNKSDVNHKDFNRSNNRVDNLEWATRSENNLWSREHISKAHKGYKHNERMRTKCSQRQITKSTNPYPTYIYKTKTGYIFRIVRYGKSIVSKQKPTLEETIAFKENWLKDHRKGETKMSKELTLADKLRLLRFGKVDNQYLENQYYDEIENALENIDEYVKEAEKEHEELMYAQKKLKALEIIKEKNIAIKQLQMSPCLEAYCTLYRYLYHDVDWKELQHLMPTQEEYELLKEVLL